MSYFRESSRPRDPTHISSVSCWWAGSLLLCHLIFMSPTIISFVKMVMESLLCLQALKTVILHGRNNSEATCPGKSLPIHVYCQVLPKILRRR